MMGQRELLFGAKEFWFSFELLGVGWYEWVTLRRRRRLSRQRQVFAWVL